MRAVEHLQEVRQMVKKGDIREMTETMAGIRESAGAIAQVAGLSALMAQRLATRALGSTEQSDIIYPNDPRWNPNAAGAQQQNLANPSSNRQQQPNSNNRGWFW